MIAPSPCPEDVDFIEAGLEDEDLAIEGHVAGKRLPVDIVLKCFGNFRAGVAGQFLGEVSGERYSPA
jgi:hypothetical protein